MLLLKKLYFIISAFVISTFDCTDLQLVEYIMIDPTYLKGTLKREIGWVHISILLQYQDSYCKRRLDKIEKTQDRKVGGWWSTSSLHRRGFWRHLVRPGLLFTDKICTIRCLREARNWTCQFLIILTTPWQPKYEKKKILWNHDWSTGARVSARN